MPNSFTIASVMSSTPHAQHQQSSSSATQDERTKGWHAQLDIHYALAGQKTVAKFQHEGPLRVLQSLYPEGDAVCHNVLVHPPSGLVGAPTRCGTRRRPLDRGFATHAMALRDETWPRFFDLPTHSEYRVAHANPSCAHLVWRL